MYTNKVVKYLDLSNLLKPTPCHLNSIIKSVNMCHKIKPRFPYATYLLTSDGNILVQYCSLYDQPLSLHHASCMCLFIWLPVHNK